MQAVKLIFPAVLIGSIVSFVLLICQWTVKKYLAIHLFKYTLSESADCSIQKSSGELDNIGSAKSASEKCQNDNTCVAYEGQNGQAV